MVVRTTLKFALFGESDAGVKRCRFAHSGSIFHSAVAGPITLATPSPASTCQLRATSELLSRSRIAFMGVAREEREALMVTAARSPSAPEASPGHPSISATRLGR